MHVKTKLHRSDISIYFSELSRLIMIPLNFLPRNAHPKKNLFINILTPIFVYLCVKEYFLI